MKTASATTEANREPGERRETSSRAERAWKAAARPTGKVALLHRQIWRVGFAAAVLLAMRTSVVCTHAQTTSPPSVLVKRPNSFRLVTAPALGDDGRFYAAARQSPTEGGVVAVDSSTLDAAWGPTTICGASFGQSGVSVGSNGMVFAVGDGNECGSGPLGILAATNGSVLWRYDAAYFPRHLPALDESRTSVYYGEGNLQSINCNTHVVNWSVSRGGNGGRGIALDGAGNVYSGTGDSSIRSYTPVGSQRWSKSYDGAVVAIANGYVLLADGTSLQAWDSGNGNLAWQATGLANPVCDESGNIYASSLSAAQVVSLTAGGAERWRSTLAGVASAAVDFVTSDGKLVVRGDNKLFLLNASDGGVIWTFSADNPLTTSSALARYGRLFVCDSQGTGYLLKTSLGYATSEWPIAQVSNRRHTAKAFDILPLPGPVAIYTQPTNQTALSGSTASFAIEAAGVPPFFYQWFFNGTNLLAAQTSAWLVLSNVALTQAGTYSVILSNKYGAVLSSDATLTVLDSSDTDGDGIPNYWELQFGLNPTDAIDAAAHPPGDRLTYWQKYLYGLDPTKLDTDGDGLSDYDELFVSGTNPLLADTDGDVIPDQWEIDHGLNPLVQDATQVGPAGVSNLQIYHYDQDPTRTNQLDQLDPRKPFYAPGTSIYEVLNNGQHTNRFYYDRADRLVGMESSRGISLAYTYDGNGNLVRQTVISRASETNGLPVLWQFLHGLTNGTPVDGPYGDPDGDRWSNYQEWLAGSDPITPNSRPSLLGNPGTRIASLTLPFTPSNFVVGVGQLGGQGADDIVLGADGNPGTNNNFLLVLTQGPTSWSTQRVDVGPFGVTSLAVGQVTNRPGPAIYAGLRQPGGTGRIVELLNTGGAWQTNKVTNSTNEAAFVLGVRPTKDLVVSLASTNSPDSATFSLAFGTNWNLSLIETNVSHRGLGILGPLAQSDTSRTTLRLLDAGGIRVGSFADVANAVFYPETGKWYVRTANSSSWTAAQAYARANGGDLATVADVNLNSFLYSQLVRAEPPSHCWVGLFRIDCSSAWQWSSGSSVGFTKWRPGAPDCAGGTERFVAIVDSDNGQWNDVPDNSDIRAILEMSPQAFDSAFALQVTLPEPEASKRINWRGGSLASGLSRGTNGTSIFYTFTDDKNADDSIDAGDDFVTAEYLVSGTNASLLTLSRQSIAALTLAQSYGLASVNFLSPSNEVFFTGEPDGQVFAWTATGPTNPMQRQLFSADYLGKAWHALAGVKTLEPGTALAGLLADPGQPNTCDVMLWPPQTSLPNLVSLPETAPTAVVLPSANPLGDFASLTVRLWDAEGNPAAPFLQYQLAGSTNWQDASLLALDGAAYNSAIRVTALPGGSDHSLIWNALVDLGAGVTTNVLLRARAQDFMLLGDWSLPTPFQVVTVENPDANGNGIPDAWELQYFGNLDQIADGDFDGDGFSNRAEYLVGTDPKDGQSYLRITAIQVEADGVRIAWKAGTKVPQYLQRSVDPGDPNGWQVVFTNSAPMAGDFLDTAAPNTAQFYRVKIGE